ncbi:hypothetical protein RBI80_16020 [Klebsiella variicola]|nr:hypothetical protein RBI80_16020 [Klebsiella variicola]
MAARCALSGLLIAPIRSPAKRRASRETAASCPETVALLAQREQEIPDGGALRLIRATHCADT